MKIKLKKIDIVANPKVPTPDSGNFKPGQDNGNVSLPVKYTITGNLQQEIEIGQPLVILRYTRNDEESLGIMITSRVDNYDITPKGAIIYTDNSVYDLEWLEDEV